VFGGAWPLTMSETLPDPDLVAALPRLRRYARVLTGGRQPCRRSGSGHAGACLGKSASCGGRASDLRAWLFTIMHNVHVNQFLDTSARNLPRVSLDADDGPIAGWQIPVRATQSDRIELNEVLIQIGRLPSDQREVLILAAVEELRYEDIARIQGVPIGTVMSRLNRAREKVAPDE